MGIVRTAKEMARHLLHKAGANRKQHHLAEADRASRFSTIYRSGTWSLGRDDVPLSGTGSSLAATAGLREALPDLVGRLGVETLVDVGCGDFTWMSQVDLPCDYLGVDIVPWLIERNAEQYGSSRRRFEVRDVVVEAAPAGDLILCREVLFHLSLADGISALRNMLASGCSHLLLTTDRATHFNSDIESGDFRLLNLEQRPFRLQRSDIRIEDGAISPGRYMGLWRADAIRAALKA